MIIKDTTCYYMSLSFENAFLLCVAAGGMFSGKPFSEGPVFPGAPLLAQSDGKC